MQQLQLERQAIHGRVRTGLRPQHRTLLFQIARQQWRVFIRLPQRVLLHALDLQRLL